MDRSTHGALEVPCMEPTKLTQGRTFTILQELPKSDLQELARLTWFSWFALMATLGTRIDLHMVPSEYHVYNPTNLTKVGHSRYCKVGPSRFTKIGPSRIDKIHLFALRDRAFRLAAFRLSGVNRSSFPAGCFQAFRR